MLTHTHGVHGILTSLSSSLGQTLVNGVQYTALGQVKQYDLGGNTTSGRVSVTYNGLDGVTLDSAQPFGALRQTLWNSTAPLVNRTLTFDAVGNVSQIVDGVNSETHVFDYDHLNRLTQARWSVVSPGWDEESWYLAKNAGIAAPAIPVHAAGRSPRMAI